MLDVQTGKNILAEARALTASMGGSGEGRQRRAALMVEWMRFSNRARNGNFEDQGKFKQFVASHPEITREMYGEHLRDNMRQAYATQSSEALQIKHAGEAGPTLDDYDNYMGSNVTRRLQRGFAPIAVPWESVTDTDETNDLRDVTEFPDNPMVGTVHKQSAFADSHTNQGYLDDPAGVTYSVDPYALGASIPWEIFLNDDLGKFRDIGTRMGVKFANHEVKFWTELHFNASGPLTGGSNLTAITGNPVLSEANLDTAYQTLRKVTINGEPVAISAPILEVGPDLEKTAFRILNSTNYRETPVSGETREGPSFTVNTVNRNFIVNTYIPIVASTANSATSWVLHARANGATPTALKVVYLRGMREPFLMMEAPNSRMVGGGEVPAMMGNFEHNRTNYKGLHPLGGAIVKGTVAIASNGSGS